MIHNYTFVPFKINSLYLASTAGMWHYRLLIDLDANTYVLRREYNMERFSPLQEKFESSSGGSKSIVLTEYEKSNDAKSSEAMSSADLSLLI
jgi:hypothetical protein